MIAANHPQGVFEACGLKIKANIEPFSYWLEQIFYLWFSIP
jgi:hypothetical protein